MFNYGVSYMLKVSGIKTDLALTSGSITKA
jgi:hypothetical protein